LGKVDAAYVAGGLKLQKAVHHRSMKQAKLVGSGRVAVLLRQFLVLLFGSSAQVNHTS